MSVAQPTVERQYDPAMLQHLQQAGVRAIDVGTKIGTSVAVAAIKSSIGLKQRL